MAASELEFRPTDGRDLRGGLRVGLGSPTYGRQESSRERTWQVQGTSYDYGWGALDADVPMPVPMIDWPWNREPSKVTLMGDYSPDWHMKGPVPLCADGHVKVGQRN